MTKAIFGFAVLALAGCSPAADNNTAAAVPTPAAVANESGNDLEKVLAMSENMRNVVLVRAITDAGLKCDGVIHSERLPDQDGNIYWRADCKGGNNSHMITITPDGTANIVSRTDR